MLLAETFLVGLGAGGGCLAHCGPALLPILLCGESRRWRLALIFTGTRLLTYSLLATVIYLSGNLLQIHTLLSAPFTGGLLLILLGVLLARYGLTLREDSCEGKSCSSGLPGERFRRFRIGGKRYAVRSGILSATGLCPPMFAFAVEALRSGSATHAMEAMGGFFLGTSIALLPLFALGAVCRGQAARNAGMLFSLLAAAMYFIQGTSLILKGVFYV